MHPFNPIKIGFTLYHQPATTKCHSNSAFYFLFRFVKFQLDFENFDTLSQISQNQIYEAPIAY